MSRKGGLGRGLTALIPQGLEEIQSEDQQGLQEVPVHEIFPNANQPRRSFDEETLEDLAASIRELGVLQPLLVRISEDRIELIAGERRLRAAKRAGLRTVPVIVRSADEAVSLEEALVENLHRQDLNPMEEAAAYQRLIEEFGHTQDQVARRVGRSRSAVGNLLRMFQLTPAVQRLVGEGLLSAGHAKALLAHPDRDFQETLARRSVEDGLSVRQVEELIKEQVQQDQDDPVPPGERSDAGGSTSGESPAGHPEPKLRPPGLLELEELLASHLDTRVSIAMSARHGKVTIEFADLEDLERIYRRVIDGASS